MPHNQPDIMVVGEAAMTPHTYHTQQQRETQKVPQSDHRREGDLVPQKEECNTSSGVHEYSYTEGHLERPDGLSESENLT